MIWRLTKWWYGGWFGLAQALSDSDLRELAAESSAEEMIREARRPPQQLTSQE